MKITLYKIHIFSNLVLYSIVPLFFVNLTSLLSSSNSDQYENILSKNFFLNVISDNDIFFGNLYTIIASIIYAVITLYFSPSLALREKIIQNSRKIYNLYGHFLYQISIFTLSIGIALAFIYGPIDDNLVSQRPKFALYIGYVKRILDPAIMSYLILFILTLKKINFRFYLIIFMYGFTFILLGSRSFILTIVFSLLLPLSFVRRSIKIDGTFLKFSLIGVVSTFLGNFIRTLTGGGDSISSPLEGFILVMSRLFVNNSLIYAAQSKFQLLNSILLLNQPRGMFENMFSFMINRTHINSQYRVPELFGVDTLTVTSRGGGEHFVSYAYGWLGLSFGLFSWFGLILIFVFYLSIFVLQRKLLSNLNLLSLLIYNLLIYIYLDSFQNLGLDSIVNKLSKGIFSTLIFYVFILCFKKIVPQNKVSIRK